MDAPALALVASTGVPPPDPAAPPDPPASEPTQKKARPSEPMIVFAYDCLRREFESLVARRPADNSTPSPSDVHQTRIALRRMRIALRLFRRMLPSKARDFRRDLRAFARALGDVRDLDVHADCFKAYAQTVVPERLNELAGYEMHLRRERLEARNHLSEIYSDERYGTLLTSFAAFLEDAPSAGAMRRWRSFKVSDGVDKYLRRSLKRVLKLGRKVSAEAHAKELHRLRIRAKRFRYELEFFVSAYPSLHKAAVEAKALQDLLGAHQDAYTAIERINKYARALRKHGGARMPVALGQLIQSERQKAREARRTFGPEWSRFERSVTRGRLAA